MPLSRWFGTRSSVAARRPVRRPRSRPLSFEVLEGRAVPSVANLLVNNHAADTGTNDTQSETSLVLTNSGLVTAFNDSGSNAGNNKFTGFAWSADGGASFTDPGTLPTNSVGDAGDPALAYDSVSGKTYLATLGYSSGNVIQVFRSTDDGHTWLAPVSAPGVSSSDSLDKEWVAVDNAAGAGQGTVYLTYTRFGGIFGSTDYGA